MAKVTSLNFPTPHGNALKLYSPTYPAPQAPRIVDIHPGSRQRPSETMEQFQSRMIAEEFEFYQNETEDEKGERREKEQLAVKEAYDKTLSQPSFGTALYQWIRKPNGTTVRTHVPRVEWANTWRRFAPSEKVFYAFLDEWDLQPTLKNYSSDYNSDSSLASLMMAPSEMEILAQDARSSPSWWRIH
ncbi:hypothetical protein BD779DRAFT_1678857 [Infundibulicybe gibba]|nr:hypothetical protein BD779DRAFT_1678857 [Infundibulicybe gibba]